MGLLEADRRGADPLDEFGRGQDPCPTSPSQDPTLDLQEASQSQTDPDPTVLQFLDNLGRMPPFLPDIVGDGGLEPDHDVEIPLLRPDPEAVPQQLLELELRRTRERLAGRGRRDDPGRDESPQVPPEVIEGEQVPVAVDVRELRLSRLSFDAAALHLPALGGPCRVSRGAGSEMGAPA